MGAEHRSTILSTMYNRNRVFAAACLGMLVFGIVLTTLGAILPVLTERLGLDKAHAGSLFLLMSGGILVGSVVFGPVVDRRGYKNLLIASVVLVLIGLEGIAFASSLGFLRGAVFLIGLGGGIINGGTNALVADISEEGRSASLSMLGVFFGIGAFGIPFMLGFLLDRFDHATLIASIGGLVVLPLLFFMVTRFPTPKQAQGFPLREGLRLAKDPTLLLMGLLLFLQSGMEIMTGGWAATFFNEELALTASDAVFVLSLFWAGMVLARLLLGSLLKRMDPSLTLKLFMGVAFAGSLIMAFAQVTWLAAFGLFLTGAGLAAGFPVILGYVGDRYPTLSGTAFSLVLVMALTGGSILPYITGLLGEAWGLRASFLLLPASLALMFLLLLPTLNQIHKPSLHHNSPTLDTEDS